MRTLKTLVIAAATLFSMNAYAEVTVEKEVIFHTTDAIDGEIPTAQLTEVGALPEGELMSLIRVRDTFTDKLLTEVDDL